MNETIKLNDRQKEILKLLSVSDIPLGRDDIQTKIEASRPTIIRDLNTLEKLKLVEIVGLGRSTAYLLENQNPLLEYIDMDDYYQVGFMERELITQADDSLLDLLAKHDFLDEYEKTELDRANQSFISRRDAMSPDGLKRDLERFTIELAWKSSEIEGNTYSLLETEELIKNLRVADGKTVLETQMVLNHKKALDFILERRQNYRKISLDDIIEIHRVLVDGLGVTTDIRIDPVRITNTNYEPAGDQTELRRKMERLVGIANAKQHPVERALILSGMIAYFQPFIDGNKRTSRLAANALLLGHDYSALSYRAVKDIEYKMAVITLYEQHSFYNYKKVFLDQFLDAAENYLAV
jgi:Fic family protein